MATAGKNSVAQCVEQAVAFLAQSDREFGAGDRRQGSEKLYGAATQAVIAAAKQRGWQYRSHRATKNAVIRLESGISGSIANCRISRRRKVPQELLSRRDGGL